MNALTGIGFAVYLGLLYFGLGAWFYGSVPGLGTTWRFFAVSTLGFGVAAIVATVGYSAGLMLSPLFWILNAAAFAGGLFFLLRHRSIFSSPGWRWPAIWSAFGLGILLAPWFVGGLQFALFQGNHHDAFNYLESAATYARLPRSEVASGSLLGIVSHGGFAASQANYYIRPSVSLLYGELQLAAPSGFLGLHYIFLCYSLFLAAGVLGLLVAECIPAVPSWLALLAGFSFSGGFWGQYILDINAWSETAWIAPEMLLVLLWFRQILSGRAASQPGDGRGFRPSLASLGVCAVSAFYIYPEGFVFFAPALAFAALLLVRRPAWRQAGNLAISLLVLGALFSIPVWNTNVTLITKQIGQASSGVDWWKYFQAPLFGMDGINRDSFSNLVDGFAGTMGIYFLTPLSGTPWLGQLTWRVALLAGFAVLVYPAAASILTPKSWRSPGGFCLLVGVALLAQCGWLCYREQYWGAGKGLSFASPVLILLCLFPAVAQLAGHTRFRMSPAVVALVLLLGSQAYFAVHRISAAAIPSGIHYPKPYPAIQGELLKTTFCFADLTFLRGLRRSDEVAVRIDNPWVESFVRMELLAHDIPSFPELPVRENRLSDRRVGSVTPERPPTVRLTLQPTASGSFPSAVSVDRLSP